MFTLLGYRRRLGLSYLLYRADADVHARPSEQAHKNVIDSGGRAPLAGSDFQPQPLPPSPPSAPVGDTSGEKGMQEGWLG